VPPTIEPRRPQQANDPLQPKWLQQLNNNPQQPKRLLQSNPVDNLSIRDPSKPPG
jgi:hypothetical protein